MTGRDPGEPHRAATPLELLFDLTFVVAFGVAAEQLAHLLAEGHVASGLTGFTLAMLGVCWAWINFSWFASAYDTDDWPFRVTTMVQMVGVLIFTLGLPNVFASIDEGQHVDATVTVAGYVVMRVAMGFQWFRAATQDPQRRSACLTYLTTILVAQAGWVLLLFVETSVPVRLVLLVPLLLVELAGPWIAETRKDGTPWHAGHLAERYGLLAIIALGEGVIGTVASLAAVVEHQGWSLDAALVGVAGTGLTFGMWWIYFLIPSGAILAAHRERVFGWGYGHILVFSAIAATGAGLHVAAFYIEDQAHISGVATVLCVAVPVGLFVLMVAVVLPTWSARVTRSTSACSPAPPPCWPPRSGWPLPGCRWPGACWSSPSRRRSRWSATKPWATATWRRSWTGACPGTEPRRRVAEGAEPGRRARLTVSGPSRRGTQTHALR